MNELPPVPPPNPGTLGFETVLPTPVPDKYPVGLIFIVVLAGLGMIGGLMTLINPKMFVGIWVVTGVPAFIYGLIYEVAMAALFVWLIQRKNKGRILGIVVSVYNMVLMGITFFSIVLWPAEFAVAMDTMSPGYSEMVPMRFLAVIFGFGALLSWAVGAAVILYLVYRKHYFHS